MRDNGPGIAPAHLPNIFEPFYRVSAARTDPGHHLGLGLDLVGGMARDCSYAPISQFAVRRIVEAMLEE